MDPRTSDVLWLDRDVPTFTEQGSRFTSGLSSVPDGYRVQSVVHLEDHIGFLMVETRSLDS